MLRFFGMAYIMLNFPSHNIKVQKVAVKIGKLGFDIFMTALLIFELASNLYRKRLTKQKWQYALFSVTYQIMWSRKLCHAHIHLNKAELVFDLEM